MPEFVFRIYYRLILRRIVKKLSEEGSYHIFYEPSKIKEWSSLLNYTVDEYTRYMGKTPKYALDMHCGNFSKHINYYLRTGRLLHPIRDLIEVLKRNIKLLDIVMKDNILSEDILAIRWIKAQYIETVIGRSLTDIKEGRIYIDKGYTSTSLWISYIGQYEGQIRKLSTHVLFLIKIPAGSYGIYLEDINPRAEYELLLERGTKFFIEKIYRLLNRPLIIICRIVK